MFESTNTMMQILSTGAGYVLPMSTQIDRITEQTKEQRWTKGIGGDAVATVVSMVALMLIGLLA